MFLAEVRDRLDQAQQHYKAIYDRKHRPLEFSPGQWVWLRLLHRPVASLQVQGRSKLGPKFFGPFKVLERVGDVAYRLLCCRREPAFMTSFMLVCSSHSIGDSLVHTPALPPLDHGRVVV
jgi:hypothetical protein